MLDDYKNNKFYNYAKNLKKYFHAYIFEVDDIETSYPLILAFIKMIICPNHYTNNKSCLDCNICHLIDENYYEDFKVIETTDKIIKKEQITKLQQELSLKSSNNTNQVYVIKEADKMNLNAANSLLKFIEEPEENIYGILITTNKKSLLSTILSRCQIIELKVEKENNYNLEDINNSLSFFTLIHEEKENSIAYLKSRYLNIYATRDDILKSFQILENLIDKEINRRNGIIDNNFSFYDIIETSLQEITLKELIFYLDKIIVMKNKLIENPYLNLNLFLDRLIIEISEVKI